MQTSHQLLGVCSLSLFFFFFQPGNSICGRGASFLGSPFDTCPHTRQQEDSIPLLFLTAVLNFGFNQRTSQWAMQWRISDYLSVDSPFQWQPSWGRMDGGSFAFACWLLLSPASSSTLSTSLLLSVTSGPHCGLKTSSSLGILQLPLPDWGCSGTQLQGLSSYGVVRLSGMRQSLDYPDHIM